MSQRTSVDYVSNIIWFDNSVGAPTLSIARYGIVFNRAAVEALGAPEYVRIGLSPTDRAIVARPASMEEQDAAFPFRNRQKTQDGSVRITNKGLMRMIEHHLKVDLRSAVKCIARVDESAGVLIAQITDPSESEERARRPRRSPGDKEHDGEIDDGGMSRDFLGTES